MPLRVLTHSIVYSGLMNPTARVHFCGVPPKARVPYSRFSLAGPKELRNSIMVVLAQVPSEYPPSTLRTCVRVACASVPVDSASVGEWNGRASGRVDWKGRVSGRVARPTRTLAPNLHTARSLAHYSGNVAKDPAPAKVQRLSHSRCLKGFV